MSSSNGSVAHNVPAWLSWALLFDTKGKSTRQQRKQIAINSFGFFNGLFTLSFAIFYLVYNLDLWPLALIVGCLSVAGDHGSSRD